jgi:hypothetical protein
MNVAGTVAAMLAATLATQVLAVGRMADVTVVDRSEGRTLQVHWHEGRAWVVGTPGNEYQIVVHNRRTEDLLAVMSVDGINVVSGETAHPLQSGYVLSPRRGMEVKGWRKSLERTAAFYFTALPDSYAARTGRPENLGVIGVALFQRKRPAPPVSVAPIAQSSPAPADAAAARSESNAQSPAAERSAKLGTGHGRSEASYARQVEFERASSAPAEIITIHYDSYHNLVARGVIREPRPFPQVPAPFPGFVPDPPHG